MQNLFSDKSNKEQPARQAPLMQSAGNMNLATLVLTVIVFGLLCFTLYETKSTKKAMQEQIDQTINSISKRFESEDTRITDLRSDIGVIQKRIGVTQKELENERALAQQLRREHQKTAQQLNSQLSQKADIEQLSSLRQESEAKIGAVSGDLSNVKGDVTNVKGDVASTRKDLDVTRRELVDAKDSLSQQIAHNRDELAELRRKGERDYIEFDIQKKGVPFPVGDVSLLLKKADMKRKKYDVVISIDDNRLEKRDRTINEPVPFLVGKTKVRYELVVNTVGKNRISGYLSIPKDKTLAAERAK